MKTKNFFTNLLFVVALSVSIVACDKKKNAPTPPTPKPGSTKVVEIGNGDKEFFIKESVSYPKGTYLLKGWVYIEDGVTVTFAPGSIIKGDKATQAAIIAKQGGKLIAQGTAQEPIVFTSNQPKGQRKPGDWGGIIMSGKARNNGKDGKMEIEGGPKAPHGGNDDNDNSGVLSYVRCEFAGYPFIKDQEINGITLGSVGKGTKIDHVQVSYCNDDSFEWFGGCVDAKYLIAYHGWDDDFDTDAGFSGKLQFLLSVRHPKIADASSSNSFESDNKSDGKNIEPFTSCVFSNVTIVGPLGQDSKFENNGQYITGGGMDPNNGSNLGIYNSAMQIRRGSRLSCFNSVAMGFPIGLIVENDKGSETQTWAKEGLLKLQNVYFAGMGILASDGNKDFEDKGKDGKPSIKFSKGFFLKAENKNKSFDNIADLKLKQPNSLQKGANYGPMAGSPLLKAASFADSKLAGFQKVDYIGAFKSDSEADDWTKGWANFDPQNTDY